jgi:Carboxypeptidase regulatory-like domain
VNFQKKMVVFSFVLVLVLSSPLHGQISASTGAVQGTVTDPQNAAVPEAQVMLTNSDTGAVSQTKTQNDGSFVFPLVAPGNYQIKVTAQGFETAELPNLRVDVTKVTNASIKLTVGQVSTVATVTDTASAVDTRTATTGDVITGTQIRDIPLPTQFPRPHGDAGRDIGAHSERGDRRPGFADSRRRRFARDGE